MGGHDSERLARRMGGELPQGGVKIGPFSVVPDFGSSDRWTVGPIFCFQTQSCAWLMLNAKRLGRHARMSRGVDERLWA